MNLDEITNVLKAADAKLTLVVQSYKRNRIEQKSAEIQ